MATLYILNKNYSKAKQCLDKIKFNTSIKHLNIIKQYQLFKLYFNLAIIFNNSYKNRLNNGLKASLNENENLIECFEYIFDLFFNIFNINDKFILQYFYYLLIIMINVLKVNDKNIDMYSSYAEKLIKYTDIDYSLDGNLYHDTP